MLNEKALLEAAKEYNASIESNHFGATARIITAYLAALPSSPVSELVEPHDLDFYLEGSRDGIATIPREKLLRTKSTLTSLSTHNAELEREVKRLQRLVPSESWYWPEDDTSSYACADSPHDALGPYPGTIAAYSCGGVAYTGYYGWLPAADDADSDDYFEVDEPTIEEAEAKMAAEIARRAALFTAPQGGDVEAERIRNGMEKILKEQSERDIPFAPQGGDHGEG